MNAASGWYNWLWSATHRHFHTLFTLCDSPWKNHCIILFSVCKKICRPNCQVIIEIQSPEFLPPTLHFYFWQLDTDSACVCVCACKHACMCALLQTRILEFQITQKSWHIIPRNILSGPQKVCFQISDVRLSFLCIWYLKIRRLKVCSHNCTRCSSFKLNSVCSFSTGYVGHGPNKACQVVAHEVGAAMSSFKVNNCRKRSQNTHGFIGTRRQMLTFENHHFLVFWKLSRTQWSLDWLTYSDVSLSVINWCKNQRRRLNLMYINEARQNHRNTSRYKSKQFNSGKNTSETVSTKTEEVK